MVRHAHVTGVICQASSKPAWPMTLWRGKPVTEEKALDWDSKDREAHQILAMGELVPEAELPYLSNGVHNVCLVGSLEVLKKTR